ncbi:MAG: hypothetical protein M1829_004462 [Trizodia sp. TS-e1964]|nr:MAG: hypothetical protein M1829_004462 [Trizodia sp. TS-e1964]
MAASGKRLIVCCDGTWMNSDNGYEPPPITHPSQNGTLQYPSNVTRLTRAIRPVTSNAKQQIVYYQAGVGTGNLVDRLLGGATGLGLSENIRAAYAFLADNYVDEQDEIFIFGFSRGAFTARSIAGLISSLGLLTRKGMQYFYPIFKDYENHRDPKYKSAFPKVPFDNKPHGPYDLDPYAKRLQEGGFTRLNVPIQVVGVWDTVGKIDNVSALNVPKFTFTGSLGVPLVSWVDEIVEVGESIAQKIGVKPKPTEYAFYDTQVHPNIKNAFQALALDEHRSVFPPTLWELPKGSVTNLKQVWFPGNHGNIGGGWPDQQIANITLAWMLGQVGELLEVDPEYLEGEYENLVDFYKNSTPPIHPEAPWAMGEIYSTTGITALSGNAVRTPGFYHRVDPLTGRPTPEMLQNTHEYVHPSVRIRYQLKGGDVNEKNLTHPHKVWTCPTLTEHGWTLVQSGSTNARTAKAQVLSSGPAFKEPVSSGTLKYEWAYSGTSHPSDSGRLSLPESELTPVELKLLEKNKAIYEKVTGIPA